MATNTDLTTDIIRQHEGYRSKAYWDRNAWRIGYGSDTTTLEDGTVVKVKKTSKTNRAAAERDLARRIPEFQQEGIIAYVGQDAWNNLTPQAQAAVTSLAYNYGSLAKLPSLRKAIKSGDMTKVANAIEARSVDNGGINSRRRKEEAALVAGHPVVPGSLPGDETAVATSLDVTPTAPTPLARPLALTSPGAAVVGAKVGAPAARATPVLPNRAGFVADTVDETRTPVLPSTPAKTSVPAWNKTVQQIGQEADNARLSGYRAIQEGTAGRPVTPGPSGPQWTSVGTNKTPMLPLTDPANGVQPRKVNTVTQRPDGTVINGSAGIAGAESLPPGHTPVLPNMPQTNTEVVTVKVRNPAYDEWMKSRNVAPVPAAAMQDISAETTRNEQAIMHQQAASRGALAGAAAGVGMGAAGAAPPPEYITTQKTVTTVLPSQQPTTQRQPQPKAKTTPVLPAKDHQTAYRAKRPITYTPHPENRTVGSGKEINGVDIAFMPKSVQDSSRWNTGY